jgi:GNAT superfamily N-acetyltransferase
VALAEDGSPVGYVYALHLRSDVREERCYVFGTVDPRWRGQGIGRGLIDFGVQRATELLQSSSHSLPRFIRVQQFEWITDAHRLYAAAGFVPVRYGDEMLRPLGHVPAAGQVDGLRIVPWPLDRNEEIRQEKNAAFADHWGSTPTDASNWAKMTAGHGSRPDLSFVALDGGDRVVAHCWCARYPHDDELLGRRDGWIESLGTLREWRGRGVASALISHALQAFAADGLTHAALDVDSDNPTGAARLYAALGFESVHRSITHEIALAGD